MATSRGAWYAPNPNKAIWLIVVGAWSFVNQNRQEHRSYIAAKLIGYTGCSTTQSNMKLGRRNAPAALHYTTIACSSFYTYSNSHFWTSTYFSAFVISLTLSNYLFRSYYVVIHTPQVATYLRAHVTRSYSGLASPTRYFTYSILVLQTLGGPSPTFFLDGKPL